MTGSQWRSSQVGRPVLSSFQTRPGRLRRCERRADDGEGCAASGVLGMASDVASLSSSAMILSSQKNTQLRGHLQAGSLALSCPDRENSSPFVLKLLEERRFSGRCYETPTPVTSTVLKWRCSGFGRNSPSPVSLAFSVVERVAASPGLRVRVRRAVPVRFVRVGTARCCAGLGAFASFRVPALFAVTHLAFPSPL